MSIVVDANSCYRLIFIPVNKDYQCAIEIGSNRNIQV